MRKIPKKSLQAEAASCRQKAEEYAGRPEASFLFRVASAFEELALIQDPKSV